MEEDKIKEQEYKKRIVRILSKDIEGGANLYTGLTKIKGVSWAISNAMCKKLKIDKKRKIGSLTEEELKEITDFLKNPSIPEYMLNRRQDFETGKNLHLASSDLDLKKETDLKRLKKIKSYRGIRHAANLPLRGQRTKAHFRKNKQKGVGIKKKARETKPAVYQK